MPYACETLGKASQQLDPTNMGPESNTCYCSCMGNEVCFLYAKSSLTSGTQALHYVELFAGQGNAFAEVRSASYNGAAQEWDFGKSFGFENRKNPFDFLSPAGFA